MRPLLLTLAGALLAGCVHGRPAAAPSPVAVTLAPLRFERIATPIELSGSLAAVQSVNVGAISGGRVTGIDVRVGDAVRAGQVIAQIDTSAPTAALRQAQASAQAAAAVREAGTSTIEQAETAAVAAAAQVESARARAALAATTAARIDALYAQGAVSQQQRDQSDADAAEARAGVAQAQAGLAGARHGVDAARAQSHAAAESALGASAGVAVAAVGLRDATITAPFAGTIVEKFVEAGAVVAPGNPIVAIQNSHDLEVDVAVPDDVAGEFSPGAPIPIRVDAAGGAPIAARVRAIVPSQNPALRSSTLKIAVPSRPALQPGMYARVSIVSHSHSGWVAPLAALVTRAGQSGVFTVRAGIATFVPLQTGIVGADSVELLGIDGRATYVAIGGLQLLDDGTRVTVGH